MRDSTNNRSNLYVLQNWDNPGIADVIKKPSLTIIFTIPDILNQICFLVSYMRETLDIVEIKPSNNCIITILFVRNSYSIKTQKSFKVSKQHTKLNCSHLNIIICSLRHKVLAWELKTTFSLPGICKRVQPRIMQSIT